MSDPFATFKAKQRESWSAFAPVEIATTPPAALLVRFAGVAAGQRVLDVACGTGVVAVTAARAGAKVDGLDLTPALLERAKENASMAGVDATFREGDVEALPYEDGTFDVVASQFGHMFAPRPDLAIGEMLRVLRPGGTIAFSTWPPEHFVGRFFALVARHTPPPPPGASPPVQWGHVDTVRARLGDAVDDLRFEREIMRPAALSVGHALALLEQTIGPLRALVLSGDAAAIARCRAEMRALAAEYLEGNTVRQDFLMTRAKKKSG